MEGTVSLNIFKKLTILLAVLMFNTACTEMHINPGWAKPMSFKVEAPEGPEIYQQAFYDGCESGYSGYANSFNKMFWKWKQDPKLAQDRTYYQMWKDAYSYCALYGMMSDEHGLGNWR